MWHWPTAGSSSTSAEAQRDDKPTVTLETPRDPDRVSSFLNIRVKDISEGVRRMERPRCSLPDPAEAAPIRDPLLHPRSRRLSHRGGPNHRPGGGLVGRGPDRGGLVVTTAVIGTGGNGSVISRLLASGGETLRLSSADKESAQKLASGIGRAAASPPTIGMRCEAPTPSSWRCGFPRWRGVTDEIAETLGEKLVVVPSNPVGIDAQGNVVHLLPKGHPPVSWYAGGCREGPAWPWHSERCRAVCSSPRATGHRTRPSSCTRPTKRCGRGSRAIDTNSRLRCGAGWRLGAVGSTRGGWRPS